jgi:phosphomannomutase
MKPNEHIAGESGFIVPLEAARHEPLAGNSENAVLPNSFHQNQEYYCPGETKPISHSVHLARLASHFAKCAECPDNCDGDAKLVTVDIQTRMPLPRQTRRSLVRLDGIRGVYLNELDRTQAFGWATAHAAMLWDEMPRTATPLGKDSSRSIGVTHPSPPRLSDIAVTSVPVVELLGESMSPPHDLLISSTSLCAVRVPIVVIGFDERPSSPDIVTGVAQGLRRMGCRVLDLGQTTGTALQFAVRHLQVDGGLFVTGSGCGPAWTGFDICGRNAVPWSDDSHLSRLEFRTSSTTTRPTRSAGSQESCSITEAYENELAESFHALRPLHVTCGTDSRMMSRTLERLFSRLPCRLTRIALATRQRDVVASDDVDVKGLSSAMMHGGQDIGWIVDDDGQRCAFLTERGRPITSAEVARPLIDFARREQRDLKVIVDRAMADELASWMTQRQIHHVVVEPKAAAMFDALHQHQAQIGLFSNGRVWFREQAIVCDAVVTLARMLQALSLSDAPFSEIIHLSTIEAFVA